MRRCDEIKERRVDRPFELKPLPLAIGLVLFAASVWGFFHYRHDLEHAVRIVQSFGFSGILFAILIMAILCVIPVPSEFFIVATAEVFGVGWGLFYSWIGAIIGAVAAMYLTRWMGQSWIRRMLPEERQRQVDEWIRRRGTLGLLTLRFVPFLPYHAANYVAGLLTVRLWPFVWTTALGIIPFFLGMGAFLLGFSSGMLPAVWAGAGMLAVLGFLSYTFRKKWLAAFAGEPSGDGLAPDAASGEKRE